MVYFFADEYGSKASQLSKVLKFICEMYVSFEGLIILCLVEGVEKKPYEVLVSFMMGFLLDGVSFERLCLKLLFYVWRKSLKTGSTSRLSSYS